MRRRALAGALLAGLLLAGCSADPGVQVSDGEYVSPDGATQEFTERGDAVEFAGPTSAGAEFDSTEYAGDVLVVNFWYANCPPCRAEAGDLEEIAAEFAPEGVQFVGVNTRDSAESAEAFARTFEVSYPSILDVDTTAVQFAFTGTITPNAVPTTLVLDREHRVAARIIGQVTEPGILRSMIRTVVDEQAAG